MPVPCPHFRLLQRRVDELSRKFVDDQVQDELANPATFQPDLDRLAAYRLLVHAEIEDFLESKAKDNIATIESRMAAGPTWMRQSPELLALAIGLKRELPQDDVLDLTRHTNFVGEVLASARSAISNNNGVKSQSFVFLSLCAGKTLDEVDGILSASLNSYGKDRGDVAHKSVTHSTSLQAPSAEVGTARTLVSQIAIYFDVCPS
jgi:hypothetical protein